MREKDNFKHCIYDQLDVSQEKNYERIIMFYTYKRRKAIII